MLPKRSLAIIVSLLVLLALAPSIMILWGHISSGSPSGAPYRNWSSTDAAPTLANLSNYYLKPIIINTSSWQINFSVSKYIYIKTDTNTEAIIELNKSSNKIKIIEIKNGTAAFTVLSGSIKIRTDNSGDSFDGYLIFSYTSGSTSGSSYIKPAAGKIRSFSVYAVYPKTKGATEGIFGALGLLLMLGIVMGVVGHLEKL